MTWEGSDRRESLPANWDSLRKRRFKMDGYRCTARLNDDTRCSGPAEECDHTGHREDHRIEKLRSLCHWHHAKRTAAQSGAARRANRRRHDRKFRRTEPHPSELL